MATHSDFCVKSWRTEDGPPCCPPSTTKMAKINLSTQWYLFLPAGRSWVSLSGSTMRRSGVRSSSAPPFIPTRPLSVGFFYARNPRTRPRSGRFCVCQPLGRILHLPPVSPPLCSLFSKRCVKTRTIGTRRKLVKSDSYTKAKERGWHPAMLTQRGSETGGLRMNAVRCPEMRLCGLDKPVDTGNRR